MTVPGSGMVVVLGTTLVEISSDEVVFAVVGVVFVVVEVVFVVVGVVFVLVGVVFKSVDATFEVVEVLFLEDDDVVLVLCLCCPRDAVAKTKTTNKIDKREINIVETQTR
jgi:hypothetical protein